MGTHGNRPPLAQTHPQIAHQWHPTKNGELTPNDVTKGSNLMVWWQHPNPTGGTPHEWEMRVDRLTDPKKPQHCSVCSGKSVQLGVNDLATTHPTIASEWHPTRNGPLQPTDVSAGSSSRHGKVWWQKQCSPKGIPHEWEATVNARTTNSQGCAICAGMQIQVGVNDLATTNPQLASEWHPTKNGALTPQVVSLGSRKNGHIWWQRECVPGGVPHEWHAPIPDRHGGQGCAVCRGLQVQAGVNDLATTHPALAVEMADPAILATDITYASGIKVWWARECDPNSPKHRWIAAPAQRTQPKPQGCAICSGSQIQVGVTDLATTHPHLADEWHPTKNTLQPTQVTWGSQKTVWWRRECAPGLFHEWSTPVAWRGSQGLNCGECSPGGGYKSHLTGWVYLIASPALDRIKVGITNYPDKRLKTHDWATEVRELKRFDTGHDAVSTETAVLRTLRHKSIPTGGKTFDEWFDGWTETWRLSDYNPTTLNEILKGQPPWD